MTPAVLPATRFDLPDGSVAALPPEARGLARDEVRLLLAAPGVMRDHIARDLPELLHPGDLVVVNTSGTIPAAVDAGRGGRTTTVHVSTQLDDGHWVVEVRRADNTGFAEVREGEGLRLPGGLRLRVLGPHPEGQRRLWCAVPMPATNAVEYLSHHGRPVAYDHVAGELPLSLRQNVFAREPGSAEMPSAGRPLSEAVLVRLMARGVPVVPVLLHTGVSSQEAHEPPQPELFAVPEVTSRLVNSTRAAGRRVVAVGTTVVRALETVADPDGRVHPATGWTTLVLDAHRPARAVGGLLTGLHVPEASHLALLEAVAGPLLVGEAYDAVTDRRDSDRYRWHEFGDAMILLP